MRSIIKTQAQSSVSVCAMIWIIYNFHSLNNAETIQPCSRAPFSRFLSLKRHFISLPSFDISVLFRLFFCFWRRTFLCFEDARLNAFKHPCLANGSGERGGPGSSQRVLLLCCFVFFALSSLMLHAAPGLCYKTGAGDVVPSREIGFLNLCCLFPPPPSSACSDPGGGGGGSRSVFSVGNGAGSLSVVSHLHTSS